MGRGRKKGGIDINAITDKNEITNMIINQINSLNKKINSFKEKEIDEHLEFVKSFLNNEKMAQFNENDNIAKSKVFYNNQKMPWLKKTLSALVKINNNSTLGTVKKYEKTVTDTLRKIQDVAKKHLRDKGYSEQFIQEVINDKDYLSALISAFNEDSSYGSLQHVEKVALTYKESKLSKKQKRALENIENSKIALDKAREQQKQFEEFTRNNKMR